MFIKICYNFVINLKLLINSIKLLILHDKQKKKKNNLHLITRISFISISL